MKRFFISYTGVDRAQAVWIAEALEAAGHETVYQHRDFHTGGNFAADIHRALQETQYTILLLSPEYFNSPYTEAEWTASWALALASGTKRLWPILIRKCQLPGLLSSISCTDIAPTLADRKSAAQIFLKDADDVLAGTGKFPSVSLSDSLSWGKPEADYRRILTQRLQGLSTADFGRESSTGNPLLFLEPYIDLQVLEKSYDGGPRQLTAFNAYQQYDRIFLVGAAGSGKSTFLRRLALDLAYGGSNRIAKDEKISRLPIFLSLWDFVRWHRKLKGTEPTSSGPRLWDYIVDYHPKQAFTNESGSVLQAALLSGRATVLLDGLDEVPSEEWPLIQTAIQVLRMTADKARYVITCRDTASREARRYFAKWAELKLAFLKDDQITGYVDLWEQEIRRVSTADRRSMRNLNEWPEIFHLGRSPFLLSLISRLYHQDAKTAITRSRIFENSLDELIWNQDDLKGSEAGDVPQIRKMLKKAGVHKSQLRPRLDEVSYQSLTESPQTPGIVQHATMLEALILLHPEESRSWARQFLKTIKRRTGIFLAEEEDETEIRFYHSSFQDYMAGSHLARLHNLSQTVISRLQAIPRLREAVLAAVSLFIHREEEFDIPLALAHRLSCESGALGHWLAGDILLELGLGRVRATVTGQQILQSVAQGLVQLIATGSLSPEDRARAGDTLGLLGDPRFASIGERLLCDNSDFVEIPPGSFRMGSRIPEAEPSEFGNKDKIDIPYSYSIGRYAVTVGQYAAFIADDGYRSETLWSNVGWKWRTFDPARNGALADQWLGRSPDEQNRPTRSFPFKWDEQHRLENRPVTGICWFEACAYAKWLNNRLAGRGDGILEEGEEIRLPREDEWEKATKLSGNHFFPWGDDCEDIASLANILASKIQRPTAVGLYPRGSTALGVQDLIGNVKEWTVSQRSPYPYHPSDGRNAMDEPTSKETRIVRGGSYLSPLSEARCAARDEETINFFKQDLGFRLVISPKAENLFSPTA